MSKLQFTMVIHCISQGFSFMVCHEQYLEMLHIHLLELFVLWCLLCMYLFVGIFCTLYYFFVIQRRYVSMYMVIMEITCHMKFTNVLLLLLGKIYKII